eukprot:991941-Pleurochrysis_carterae.AAC.2
MMNTHTFAHTSSHAQTARHPAQRGGCGCCLPAIHGSAFAARCSSTATACALSRGESGRPRVLAHDSAMVLLLPAFPGNIHLHLHLHPHPQISAPKPHTLSIPLHQVVISRIADTARSPYLASQIATSRISDRDLGLSTDAPRHLVRDGSSNARKGAPAVAPVGSANRANSRLA